MKNDHVPNLEGEAGTKGSKMVTATKAYYFSVGALLAGAAIGAGLVAASMSPDLSLARQENSDLRDKVAAAEEEVEKTKEDFYEIRDNFLKGSAELDERELALDEREASINAAEEAKLASELRDGFHTVGKTVEAGTYSTTVTSGLCYYAWKTGTGSGADILDNNIVKSGPATITLQQGEYVEISKCGTWTKE